MKKAGKDSGPQRGRVSKWAVRSSIVNIISKLNFVVWSRELWEKKVR